MQKLTCKTAVTTCAGLPCFFSVVPTIWHFQCPPTIISLDGPKHHNLYLNSVSGDSTI